MSVIAQLRSIYWSRENRHRIKHVDNVRYTWDEGKLRKNVYRYRSDRIEITHEHTYVDPAPDLCTFLDAMGQENKKGTLTFIYEGR